MYDELNDTEFKIVVSDDFANIFRLFNVFDQKETLEKFKKTHTEEDFYLLMSICVDRHNDDDMIVCNNFEPYIPVLDEIASHKDNIDNNMEIIPILAKLGEITKDKYINTEILVDKDGNYLNVLTKEEIRNIKIKNTLNK